jgi:hypothetical protein
MDIGLIELTDVTKWVPQVYGIGTLGPPRFIFST